MKARFWWHLLRFRPLLFCLTLLSWILASCFPLVSGLITRAIFDTLSGASVSRLHLWALLALLLVTEVVSTLVLLGWLFLHLTFESTLEALLRTNLFRWLLRPGSHSLPASPGEAVSRFRDDAEEMIGPINEWYRLAGEGCFALLAIIVMVHINPFLTLLALCPIAIVVTMLHQARTRLQVYRSASRVATGQVTGFLGELFGAVLAVKVARAETTVLERFRTLNEARRSTALKDTLFQSLLESFQTNIGTLSTGIILLLAARAMQGGSFTVGDFALFVTYLNEVLQVPRRVGRLLASQKVAEVSHGRLMGLLPGARPEALIVHTPVVPHRPLPAVSHPPRMPADYLERLDITGLAYCYPGTTRGIEGITLSLQRGSFTVITGRIGAGKTTLLQTLLGLLPKEAGEIRWNGQIVADPATFFVPPRSAYLPQIPRLFSDTWKANILLGLPVEPSHLEAALRLAALERDLAAIPNGLETLIGSRGMRLSGGQAQRTAAARMFVRQPELLVVDDLSSALDVETEHLIWQRLLERGETTCLAVSHQPTALRRANHIIIMKEGKVEAEGSLETLLTTCAEMRRLWQGVETPPGR
ncbi:MAG TPA: ABC transporter ATP-binding protein [Ktedonobacterales bacterium]|nr:ABC transporter ATP-binding protein [Ktedonobacterales bacterium]